MAPAKFPTYFIGLYTNKNASIYGEYPEDIRGRHHGNYGTDGGYMVSVECRMIDEDGYKPTDIDNWLPACIFVGKKEGDEITVPVLEEPEDYDFDEELEKYRKLSAEERAVDEKQKEERKPIGTRMITLKLYQMNPKYGCATTFEQELQRATANLQIRRDFEEMTKQEFQSRQHRGSNK